MFARRSKLHPMSSRFTRLGSGLAQASLFRTDGVRTSQQCVCISVYSQTLTAISIFKYNNIVCIIQVHTSNHGGNLPLGPQEACQAARAVVKLRRFYLPNQPNCNHLLGSVWVYLGDQLFGANSGDDPRHPRIEGTATAPARRCRARRVARAETLPTI